MELSDFFRIFISRMEEWAKENVRLKARVDELIEQKNDVKCELVALKNGEMIDLHYNAMKILHKEGFTVYQMAKVFSAKEYHVQTHLNLYLGTK